MADLSKIMGISVDDLAHYCGHNSDDIDKVMGATWRHGPEFLGEFYQGGYYFGTQNGYYLICAPLVGQGNLKWKTETTVTPGAASLTDGYANTLMMDNDLHPAGKFCIDLSVYGFSDWYLPARDELNLLYTNYSFVVAAGAGNFAMDYYFSSTDSSSGAAFGQHFSTGAQVTIVKADAHYFRAIRRVAI